MIGFAWGLAAGILGTLLVLFIITARREVCPKCDNGKLVKSANGKGTKFRVCTHCSFFEWY